jgi:hypothetical protein
MGGAELMYGAVWALGDRISCGDSLIFVFFDCFFSSARVLTSWATCGQLIRWFIRPVVAELSTLLFSLRQTQKNRLRKLQKISNGHVLKDSSTSWLRGAMVVPEATCSWSSSISCFQSASKQGLQYTFVLPDDVIAPNIWKSGLVVTSTGQSWKWARHHPLLVCFERRTCDIGKWAEWQCALRISGI